MNLVAIRIRHRHGEADSLMVVVARCMLVVSEGEWANDVCVVSAPNLGGRDR